MEVTVLKYIKPIKNGLFCELRFWGLGSDHTENSKVLGRLYGSSGHTINVTKSYDASYATWVYGKSSTGITGWVRADFLEWL